MRTSKTSDTFQGIMGAGKVQPPAFLRCLILFLLISAFSWSARAADSVFAMSGQNANSQAIFIQNSGGVVLIYSTFNGNIHIENSSLGFEIPAILPSSEPATPSLKAQILPRLPDGSLGDTAGSARRSNSIITKKRMSDGPWKFLEAIVIAVVAGILVEVIRQKFHKPPTVVIQLSRPVR